MTQMMEMNGMMMTNTTNYLDQAVLILMQQQTATCRRIPLHKQYCILQFAAIYQIISICILCCGDTGSSHPRQRLSTVFIIQLFNIHAEMLPWFFLAQTFILESEFPIFDLLGIVFGHVYHYCQSVRLVGKALKVISDWYSIYKVTMLLQRV